MPAGVAETDDFFPMARAIAAGTRPPATNRALAGSVPAPILFSSPFMPNPDLSILVVDDAKFSSAMIGRALSQAGYQDIRFASSASEALQQLEQRPVSVLLADWLMPEMDGLELTARVRQLDESINHYTYIVLLTGKEGENVLGEAFDRGVDDFVSKAAMNEQLVPRIYAADRLCNTLQRLLVENRLLTENIARMEERNLVDTLTGLGNPATCARSWPTACARWKPAVERCATCWSACPRHRSCASGTARPSIASCCSAWPGACNSWSGRWTCWCAWTSSISP